MLGVASVVLRAAGCQLRPSPDTYDGFVASFGPRLISYWKFQNSGADANGTQHAAITGSPELNVATIVDLDTIGEGAPADGECIAWPGNPEVYAEAGHHARYKTAQGTIVVTFQRDTANQKSTLVAADRSVGGTSSGRGGLSIEVEASGAPRCFLRRQSDGVPVILLGQAGDVALNEAYSLIFKWGPPGLSLALWNADGPLVRRLTDPLSDGVAGTSPIRFGLWHDGSSTPHAGPFGRVVWLDRRITDLEEQDLARARTISRPVAPPRYTPFNFVTTFNPAVTHAGVTTRPVWTPANPMATSVIDPSSGLRIVRITGELSNPVFTYNSSGAATNTGLIFGRAFGNTNSATSYQTFNADGTLIQLSERFNLAGEPAGTLVRQMIIDVTGRYSGGVPFRCIRASSTLMDGIPGEMMFWDLANPFRMFVKSNDGRIDAWYPIGTSGEKPNGPGTRNTWIEAPTGYNSFTAPANGRGHDTCTSRDGRWHIASCRRNSDNRWGGLRVDLQNRSYGKFQLALLEDQNTSRPSLRQTSSLTGNFANYGDPTDDYEVVNMTTGARFGPIPNADFSHPCMFDVNGVELFFGVRGSTFYSQQWNWIAGTTRTVAQIPASNPTHVSVLLGDRIETYGATGSGATTGDRYIIQSVMGGGRRGLVAIRPGPNDTNIVRWIGDHRCIRTSNYNEPHTQGWFGGATRGGMAICRSNWAAPGVESKFQVSTYLWLLPSGWASPNNNGS
jgi:hypothetical protein